MAKEFNLIQIHLNDGWPIKQARVMPNVAVVSREIVKTSDRITGWKLQINMENDRWASFYIPDSEPQNLANPELPDCTIFINDIQVIKGVSLHKRTGKWMAYIKKDGKQHHLGSYNTPEEASEVRNMASLEFFGGFSRN